MLALIFKPVIANENGVGMTAPLTDQSRADFRDERPGSAETRGRGNIWPKGGDISVAPYSSTAPPVMKSATMPRILSRMRDPP